MKGYRLSHRAERDLLNIFLYSLERFGPLQAETYRSQLRQCFELLVDRPQLGRACPMVGESVRRHEHGSHVILYEAIDDDVRVIAVVHRRSVRLLTAIDIADDH